MLSKRSIPTAAWVFVIAFAVRLLVLVRLTDSPHLFASSGDMRFYSDWGLRIAAGHWTDHRAFYGLPGYPFFLGALYAVFGFNPFVAGFLQAGSDAGIAALLFLLGRTIVPGPKGTAVAWLAAAGWIFYQPAQAFSVILMPTTWLVLAFWGVVWISMRSAGQPSPFDWKQWLGIGALTGIVATVVATILFVLPLPMAAAARSLRTAREIAAAWALLIAGVLLGTAPCWVHNYWIAGEPVLLTAHSGVNFWIGNNPSATGYPKMPPGLRSSQEGMLKDSIRMAEAAAGRPLKRTEVSQFWSAKANAYIHEHPREWRALMLRKLRNFWSSFQYDDVSIITPLWEDGILTPGLRFGIIAALAFPGLLFALGRYRRSLWIVAAVLLHMAALLPVFVTERYRLAAVPGLLLLAAIGLVDLWETLAVRAAGWWRPALGYISVGAVAVWFVSRPQPDPALWSLDCYNSGVKALDAGEVDRAQKKLELAYAYVPDNGETNFVLGNLWLKKNDRARAKAFYKQAISLSDQTIGAFNNLAVLAVNERDWDAAKGYLRSALRVEPDDAKMIFLLAYAEYCAGDPARAKTALARALALRPNQPEFKQLQEDILAGRPPKPFSIQP